MVKFINIICFMSIGLLYNNFIKSQIYGKQENNDHESDAHSESPVTPDEPNVITIVEPKNKRDKFEAIYQADTPVELHSIIRAIVKTGEEIDSLDVPQDTKNLLLKIKEYAEKIIDIKFSNDEYSKIEEKLSNAKLEFDNSIKELNNIDDEFKNAVIMVLSKLGGGQVPTYDNILRHAAVIANRLLGNKIVDPERKKNLVADVFSYLQRKSQQPVSDRLKNAIEKFIEGQVEDSQQK